MAGKISYLAFEKNMCICNNMVLITPKPILVLNLWSGFVIVREKYAFFFPSDIRMHSKAKTHSECDEW